uniref:Uncharacterized protein n=1 Tax=Anguilla anguilla TaxID=7936 RepID=A0A0E9SMK7_ANGAN
MCSLLCTGVQLLYVFSYVYCLISVCFRITLACIVLLTSILTS